MELSSQVIVTAHPDETIQQLRSLAHHNERIEVIFPEEKKQFQVKDAKRAIEKAYIASYEKKIIILVSEAFSEVVQNKLLKVIEEPPPNTDFILLLSSKSTLLPTITSRLPVKVLDEVKELEPLGIDVSKMDVRSVYDFAQKHIRSDSQKAREIIERIGVEAVKSGKFKMDENTLNMLKNSSIALDRGSPPSFVLIGVLLKLLAKKKR